MVERIDYTSDNDFHQALERELEEHRQEQAEEQARLEYYQAEYNQSRED